MKRLANLGSLDDEGNLQLLKAAKESLEWHIKITTPAIGLVHADTVGGLATAWLKFGGVAVLVARKKTLTCGRPGAIGSNYEGGIVLTGKYIILLKPEMGGIPPSPPTVPSQALVARLREGGSRSKSDSEYMNYSDTKGADDDVQSTRMISRQLGLLFSCNSSFIGSYLFACIGSCCLACYANLGFLTTPSIPPTLSCHHLGIIYSKLAIFDKMLTLVTYQIFVKNTILFL